MHKISKYALRHKYKPFTIKNSLSHSMGASLHTYIDIKMHHLIKENDFDQIYVVGEFDRSCSVSRYEKKGKSSNWQRPTAEIAGKDLYLKCFPGMDYVKHYGSLVSSYLALNNRDLESVSYILPTDTECWDAVETIGLEKVPLGDVLVLGHGLNVIAGADDWSGNDHILWTQREIHRKKVTYLVVQFSFWGDILRRIVNVLASRGFKHMVFTAKVGALNNTLVPNFDLVTGTSTLLNGEYVEWENLIVSDKIKHNNLKHVNSASVIYEDINWVNSMSNFDLVDSEIGEFAKGAKENNLSFGYLHFISNSLSKIVKEDLSNEREPAILQKRAELIDKIKSILDESIESIGEV